MWPMSAVASPIGERDLVTVWLTNVCLGNASDSYDVGMSLAQWTYDPTAPPLGQAITAEVLVPELPFRYPFGEAAMLGDDGFAYLYGCDTAVPGDPLSGPGPCFVARTHHSRTAEPEAYEFWDGTQWQPHEDAAAPMELPMGPNNSEPTPPGGFSVVEEPSLSRYAMVYSPWPAWVSHLELRVADSPVGPWSEPTAVRLPECEGPSGEEVNRCYAASAQPAFSDEGRMGLGYYDQAVTTEPNRGAYMVTTVEVPA